MPRWLRHICRVGFALAVAAELGAQGDVVVLDSIAVRSSGVRTLGELLAGRVPGLSVTLLSGAQGMAPHVAMRGMVEGVGAVLPALYVDGMLWRDDQHAQGWATAAPMSPSHGWQMPVEEIAEVRVLLGPSAGLDVPHGAARGAVVVRTRDAARDAWRVEGSTQALWYGAGAALPSRRTAVGILASDDPTNYCTLQDIAAGCVATGTRVAAPFGGDAVFDASAGARAQLAAGGAIGGGALQLHATTERGGAPVDEGAFTRHDLAATLRMPALFGTDLRATLRHARLDGGYPGYSFLRYTGTLTPYPDDPFPAPPVAAALLRLTPSYGAQLTGLSLALARPLTRRTALRAMVSGSRSTRDTELRDIVYVEFYPATDRSARRLDDVTAQLEFRGETGRWRGLHAAARAGVIGNGVWRVDQREVNVRDPDATFDVRNRARYAQRAASLYSRLELGSDEATLGLGLRQDRSILRGQQPQIPLLKFADARWSLDRLPLFPARGPLRGLTLRAAYGESADLLGVFAESSRAVVAPLTLQAERVIERSIGADATLGAGATLRLRRFGRSHADARIGGAGINPAAWVTEGGEVALAWRGASALAQAWNFELFYADAASRYTRVPFGSFVRTHPLGGSFSQVFVGARVGNVWTATPAFADFNDDGIISPDEVEAPTSTYRNHGTQVPTRMVGASGALPIGRWLRAGATLDAKWGHVRVDGPERVRCTNGLCDARYQLDTPLGEQMRAARGIAPVSAGDFLRLRDVWVRSSVQWRGQPVEFTLAAQNLLTLTRYRGGDPEVGTLQAPGVFNGETFEQPVAPTLTLRIALRAGGRAPQPAR